MEGERGGRGAGRSCSLILRIVRGKKGGREGRKAVICVCFLCVLEYNGERNETDDDITTMVSMLYGDERERV